MLNLVIVNVGNSTNSTRISIVVLTLIAWATIVTSVLMVSYDLQIKTWHSWLTFSSYFHLNRAIENIIFDKIKRLISQ